MAEPKIPEEARSRLPHFQRLTAFETVLFAGGMALFLVLLYVMATSPRSGTFLNPPLVAIAGVILLWPLRQHQTAQALMLSGGFLLLMWLFARLSGILLPFVLVYVLAYLFNPFVTEVHERFKVPRWTSSLLATALVLGILALFVFLLVPNIVGELRTLASRIVDSLTDLRQWLATTTTLDRLEETGLINKADVNARLSAFVREQADKLASGIPDAAQGLVRSIGSLLGLVTILAITPVLLFYMLKDYPAIQDHLVRLFPTFDGRRDYLVQAGRIVGSYLRGQLTISTLVAFLVTTALLVLKAPFALLIGLLAGILNMIPNLGIIITYVVGILVALVFGDPWYVDMAKILGVLLAESLLEQSVLTPNILAYHVGLHPVLILLSLFVFGYFMGLFGLLIAVPATAILVTFYQAYRDELTMELSSKRARGPLVRWRRQRGRGDKAAETSPPAETPREDAEPGGGSAVS